MGGMACRCRTALSEERQWQATDRSRAYVANLLPAALVQPDRSGVQEALYDSARLRHFAGIDLGREAVPAAVRHLLEQHKF